MSSSSAGMLTVSFPAPSAVMVTGAAGVRMVLPPACHTRPAGPVLSWICPPPTPARLASSTLIWARHEVTGRSAGAVLVDLGLGPAQGRVFGQHVEGPERVDGEQGALGGVGGQAVDPVDAADQRNRQGESGDRVADLGHHAGHLRLESRMVKV